MTVTTETRERFITAVARLAAEPELAEIVKSIKARPETTQGHYGDFMALLSDVTGGQRMVLAGALIENGAGRYTIKTIIEIIGSGVNAQ